MNTTRREFIKLLTGTVIAISLPTIPKGLLPDKDEGFEFTLERIEITPLMSDFGWAVRGLAIPKNKKISPAYFAVKIDDIKDWGNKSFKKKVLEEVKTNVKFFYRKKRRVI